VPAIRTQTGGHVVKPSMNWAVLRLLGRFSAFAAHGTRSAQSGAYGRSDRFMSHRQSDRRFFSDSAIQ
jgi:hypothetical protein